MFLLFPWVRLLKRRLSAGFDRVLLPLPLRGPAGGRAAAANRLPRLRDPCTVTNNRKFIALNVIIYGFKTTPMLRVRYDDFADLSESEC